jgi:hypothetical protein
VAAGQTDVKANVAEAEAEVKADVAEAKAEAKADMETVKADMADMKALLEKLVAQSLQNAA